MIRADGLRRVFGSTIAVEDVSLCVPDGAILALLGPNGAGKTTTVRMLAGLLAPSAGQAEVAGCDVRDDPAAVRARVGLVTDSPGLHDQMTPVDYLDFFGQVYGLDAATRRERIDRLLSQFELQSARRTRMATFSRGMQQKVALARALLHEPTAVFLDEPTAGLDPLAARVVRDLIVGLKNASRSIIAMAGSSRATRRRRCGPRPPRPRSYGFTLRRRVSPRWPPSRTCRMCKTPPWTRQRPRWSFVCWSRSAPIRGW